MQENSALIDKNPTPGRKTASVVKVKNKTSIFSVIFHCALHHKYPTNPMNTHPTSTLFCCLCCGMVFLQFFTASAQNKQPGNRFNSSFQQLSKFLIEDGQTTAWLKFPEERLAELSEEELRLLINHIYARKGVKFTNRAIADYFKQFSWYTPSIASTEATLQPNEEYNISLIQAFQKAKSIPIDHTSTDAECMKMLEGCWQLGTATVAAGYAERFVFYQTDKSFALKANQMQESVYRKNLGYSGRFNLLAGNKIELEIYAKDVVRKIPGGTYRDLKTGKNVTRTGLKIFTEDVETAHEFKTMSISDVSVVAVEENLTKMFVKIDGVVYWRINTDPGGCD